MTDEAKRARSGKGRPPSKFGRGQKRAGGNNHASQPAPTPDLVVRIDKDDIATPQTRSTLPEIRESNAVGIARLLIYIFAGCLLCSFGIIVTLLILAIELPEDVVTKIIPALGSIFEIIKIIGTIFGSLLAFILGYYFSQAIKSHPM